MRTIKTNRAGIILGLGILILGARAGPARASERTPVVTTPHFAFYSDFDTNLNDALIAAGGARKGGKPELFHSGAEASCFGKLPDSARAGWDGAVDYYTKIISPVDWTGRQQYLLRVQLAGFDEELKDAEARQFVEIARSFPQNRDSEDTPFGKSSGARATPGRGVRCTSRTRPQWLSD